MKPLILATLYAVKGLVQLSKEKAARREIFIFLISLAIFISDLSVVSLPVLLLAIIVLGVESLNTAIEELCNIITVHHDERIGKIKDLAAAAVFLTLCAWTISLVFYVSVKVVQSA